jgi:hypothetical protein
MGKASHPLDRAPGGCGTCPGFEGLHKAPQKAPVKFRSRIGLEIILIGWVDRRYPAKKNPPTFRRGDGLRVGNKKPPSGI